MFMRKLCFPKKYNPHLDNISHNVPTNSSLKGAIPVDLTWNLSTAKALWPNSKSGHKFHRFQHVRDKNSKPDVSFCFRDWTKYTPWVLPHSARKGHTFVRVIACSLSPSIHPKHRFLCKDIEYIKTKFHKDNLQHPPPSLQGIFRSRSLTLIIFVENIFNM
jgi:hypothetical protein